MNIIGKNNEESNPVYSSDTTSILRAHSRFNGENSKNTILSNYNIDSTPSQNHKSFGYFQCRSKDNSPSNLKKNNFFPYLFSQAVLKNQQDKSLLNSGIKLKLIDSE